MSSGTSSVTSVGDQPRQRQRSSKSRIAREAEYRKSGRVDTPRPIGTQLTNDRLSRSFLSISSENLLRSSRETILSDHSSDSKISGNSSEVMRNREKKAKLLGKASCYVFDW